MSFMLHKSPSDEMVQIFVVVHCGYTKSANTDHGTEIRLMHISRVSPVEPQICLVSVLLIPRKSRGVLFAASRRLTSCAWRGRDTTESSDSSEVVDNVCGPRITRVMLEALLSN